MKVKLGLTLEDWGKVGTGKQGVSVSSEVLENHQY